MKAQALTNARLYRPRPRQLRSTNRNAALLGSYWPVSRCKHVGCIKREGRKDEVAGFYPSFVEKENAVDDVGKNEKFNVHVAEAGLRVDLLGRSDRSINALFRCIITVEK